MSSSVFNINNIVSYKLRVSYEQREKLSYKILNLYKGYIPVIIESKTVCLLKEKFLVPEDVTAFLLLHKLRINMHLLETESYFLFNETGNFITLSEMMGNIYDKYKNSDGFLYINLEKESTFGNG